MIRRILNSGVHNMGCNMGYDNTGSVRGNHTQALLNVTVVSSFNALQA